MLSSGLRNVHEITHLTFDCYGTLIDWETGILGVLESLLKSHRVSVAPENILTCYSRHEAAIESQPWRPYGEVLKQTAAAIAKDFGIVFSEQECGELPRSVANWPPFPDTTAALRKLKTRYKLIILSNTDDALFAETARKLQVQFDEVITAEQIRSYKPGQAHFIEALRRLDTPPQHILHVAQSLYHDHVPAQRLGFRTAWINRPSILPETGLAPPAKVKPDLESRDLAGLARLLFHA